jgi:hypothetical protein
VLRWVHPCVFVMLNPSTADASVDDPTIRRCVGFAASWSCTELIVVNLYAYRATDPSELLGLAAPVAAGPDNDWHVREEVGNALAVSGVVVAAWGAHEAARWGHRGELRRWLHDQGARCLGTTKGGAPRHPLYLRRDAALQPWPRP